ncbi:MAG: rhodanese-like domain-containing protein [Armatimonadota bacterium]|nr:rhodanese-like domain-containing protein [Armatimonadota bacterium]
MSLRTTRRGGAQQPSTTGYLVVGLVVLLAVAAAATWGLRGSGRASYPDEISTAEAAARRGNGAFILDVREPQEWHQVHIPGSTLIPLGALASRVNEVPSDRDVVVVCRTGNRSRQGRDILRRAGYTKVTSMAGGIQAWVAAGYPAVSGP